MASLNDDILEKCLNHCLTQKRIAYKLSEFQQELNIDKINLLIDSFNNATAFFKISNFEEIVINIQVCIFIFFKNQKP